MAYNNKISDLQVKIKKLEETKAQLEATRNSEIAAIITRLDLSSIDDEVLTGGLLHLKELLQTSDKQQEEWRASGRKFLRRKQVAKK
ncbi:MAG: hypothetical protein RI883_2141 [Bacteroidota bacterium]|jgi:hypothetical protein